MELLVRLNAQHGITIAMVTHEPEMSEFVSRVILFKDGQIIDQGKPAVLRETQHMDMPPLHGTTP